MTRGDTENTKRLNAMGTVGRAKVKRARPVKKIASSPPPECIKLAARLTVRARIFYGIWWLYEGSNTRTMHFDTMNQYPDFFRFDAHAHFFALVMYVAALYETRRDTVNLAAIVARSQHVIAHCTYESAKAMLEATEAVSCKVRVLRNKLFAHRSASLSYADAFRMAELTPDQLRDLISDGLHIANTLLTALGLQNESFFELPRADAKTLLDDLATMHAQPHA
jgi:hypothetical protein